MGHLSAEQPERARGRELDPEQLLAAREDHDLGAGRAELRGDRAQVSHHRPHVRRPAGGGLTAHHQIRKAERDVRVFARGEVAEVHDADRLIRADGFEWLDP